NTGTLAISHSTVANNMVSGTNVIFSEGGGILNEGVLHIGNSTIAGNRAFDGQVSSDGGGISHLGKLLTVHNSTISGNSTDRGGVIFFYSGTTVNLRNTILAGNDAGSGPDLVGTLTSSGYNLIGNSSGGGGYSVTDLLDVDPLLGPLADNGG